MQFSKRIHQLKETIPRLEKGCSLLKEKEGKQVMQQQGSQRSSIQGSTLRSSVVYYEIALSRVRCVAVGTPYSNRMRCVETW